MATFDLATARGYQQAEMDPYLRSIYNGMGITPRMEWTGDGGDNGPTQERNYYVGDNRVMPYYRQEPSPDNNGTMVNVGDPLGYRGRITPLFDPAYEGGVYGSYEGNFDPEGNLIDTRFVKGERHKGFLGENLSWIGPLMVMGFAALMAAPGMLSGAATGNAAPSAAEIAAAATEPVSEAMIAEAVNGKLAAAIVEGSGGLVPVSVANGIQTAVSTAQAGKSIYDVVKSIPGVGPAITGAVDRVLGGDTAGTGTGILGGLFGGEGNNLFGTGVAAAGAYKGMQDLKDASGEAAGAQRDLGDRAFRDYTQAGQNLFNFNQDVGSGIRQQWQDLAKNQSDWYNTLAGKYDQRYGDLGGQGRGMFELIGNEASRLYTGIGDKASQGFTNIAGTLKDKFQDFTPYSLTTSLGKSTGTGMKLAPNAQATVDQAGLAAAGGFRAANAIDLDRLREQEYGLAQELYKPGDERLRLATENRLRAQGRLDLNYGSYGGTPEQNAQEEAMRMRDLATYKDADNQALGRWTGLLSGAAGASQVPLSYAQGEMAQIAQGTNLAATKYGNELQGAQAWVSPAEKAIGARSSFDTRAAEGLLGGMTRGAEFDLGMRDKGIAAGLGQENKAADVYGTMYGNGIGAFDKYSYNGVDDLSSFINSGLGKQFELAADSIATKLGGEKAALNALVKMFAGISGLNLGSAKNDNGQPLSLEDMLARAANYLQDYEGLSKEESLDWLVKNLPGAGDTSGLDFSIGSDYFDTNPL